MSEWRNFVTHPIDTKNGETTCRCGKHTLDELEAKLTEEDSDE